MFWKVGDSFDRKEEILRCIHVGLLCVQERAMDRPTMSEVVSMFNNETMILPSPKQPAFFSGRKPLDSIPRIDFTISVNELSISASEMEAR